MTFVDRNFNFRLPARRDPNAGASTAPARCFNYHKQNLEYDARSTSRTPRNRMRTLMNQITNKNDYVVSSALVRNDCTVLVIRSKFPSSFASNYIQTFTIGIGRIIQDNWLSTSASSADCCAYSCPAICLSSALSAAAYENPSEQRLRKSHVAYVLVHAH